MGNGNAFKYPNYVPPNPFKMPGEPGGTGTTPWSPPPIMKIIPIKNLTPLGKRIRQSGPGIFRKSKESRGK